MPEKRQRNGGSPGTSDVHPRADDHPGGLAQLRGQRALSHDPASDQRFGKPSPQRGMNFMMSKRISYHSELVIVQTSTARSIIHQGRLPTMLNQREVSARRAWSSRARGPRYSSERPTSCGSGAATRARIVSPSSISPPRPKAPPGSWPARSRTSSASPSYPGTTPPTLPTPFARS